jgi:transposase
MGIGTKQRVRRVVWHYDFKRSQHDNRAINAMVTKAEQVADGTRALKKERFVKLTGHTKDVDWDLVDRARYLAGLKGYVTNLDPAVMSGAEVVACYKTLYQVEKSFRITKSDLAARPIFHHLTDSIEAHLTIVLAALAVARDAEQATGSSVKKILHTLRPLRSATITIGGQQIQAQPRIDDTARAILDALNPDGGH